MYFARQGGLSHMLPRNKLGILEFESGNMERAVKQWMIAAFAGQYNATNEFITYFDEGYVSRDAIDSILAAYNNSCAEMRSEARDALIWMWCIAHIGGR